MNITIQTSRNCQILEEFFEFNALPVEKIDLYNSLLDTYGRYDLTNLLSRNESTLLILSTNNMNQIMNWSQSKNQCIEFLQKNNNKIWVWSDLDSSVGLFPVNHSLFSDLSQISPGAITWFLDAPLTVDPSTIFPSNIRVQIFPHAFFLSSSLRIHGGRIKKENCSKEFLLTTIKKGRIHRESLWNELSKRPGLLDKGHAFYKTWDEKWVGSSPNLTSQRSQPSMDLYLDSWLEIVPESAYENVYFITEKTVKPLATKTPFLAISTPGYLKFLKTKGFKTFDSLIDESYNEQTDINDQARMLVDTLESIISSGAKDFYNACSSILDYNYQHLQEIAGGWEHNMDEFIWRNLENISK